MLYSSNDFDRYIKNYPVKVFCDGFESNLLRLQSNGWMLNVSIDRHEHYAGYSVYFAGKHKETHLELLSNRMEIDFNPCNVKGMMDYLRDVVIPVHIAPNICMRIIPIASVANFMQFKPYDARPEMVEISRDLNEMCLFRAIDDVPEYYLNKYDTYDVLKLLKKKQDVKQKEIREKQRKEQLRNSLNLEELTPQKDVKAQLVLVT